MDTKAIKPNNLLEDSIPHIYLYNAIYRRLESLLHKAIEDIYEEKGE